MADTFSTVVQEAISRIENFDNQLHSDSAWAHIYAKEAEYNLIQEVIFDMAYDADLGLLTQTETDLYNIVSLAWANVHLVPTASCKDTCERDTVPLNREMQAIFFARLQDKLDQRLQLLPCHLDLQLVDNSRKLFVRNLNALLRLHATQSKFVETISLICSVTSQLFSDVRNKVQSKVNLHIASVLVEEANCLMAQITNLKHRIIRAARKPSARLNELVRSKIAFCSELHELRAEVDSLERTLSAYRSQDAQYHDLVRRYKECQRQIDVRNGVMVQKEAFNGSSFYPSRPRDRRSFSLNSRPSTMTHF